MITFKFLIQGPDDEQAEHIGCGTETEFDYFLERHTMDETCFMTDWSTGEVVRQEFGYAEC